MAVTAAVLEQVDAPFVLQEVELGDPRADEVVVEIDAVGLCHTDLVARAGGFPTPFPVVLGHEGTGTVSALGDEVDGLAVGDRVALSFDSCGRCPTCTVGKPSYCHEFLPRNFMAARMDGSSAFSRDGEELHSHFFGQSSFATQTISHARSVVKIDADIPAEVLAPFGCGFQTGAGAVMRSLAVPAGATLAVFGAGGVGMAAVMAAHAVGCARVIAVDLDAGRLALARELGATDVVDASGADAVEAIQALTGAGVDYAVECTGVPAVLRQAVESTAPTGSTAVVGAPPFGTDVSLDVNGILALGRTIRGVVEGDSVTEQFIPELVELWRQGRFPVERVVRTYDFDDIASAVDDAVAGTTIKPVLTLR